MAVDYTLKWECELRMHFGEGDAVHGAVTVLDMLKAHDRAHTASELMRQEGKDPATESVTIRRVNPDGSMVDQEVTIAEMEAQAEPLKDWESHCAGSGVDRDRML